MHGSTTSSESLVSISPSCCILERLCTPLHYTTPLRRGCVSARSDCSQPVPAHTYRLTRHRHNKQSLPYYRPVPPHSTHARSTDPTIATLNPARKCRTQRPAPRASFVRYTQEADTRRLNAVDVASCAVTLLLSALSPLLSDGLELNEHFPTCLAASPLRPCTCRSPSSSSRL